MSQRAVPACFGGVLLLASLTLGCVSSGSTWNASGYRQSAFGYTVAFRDAKVRSLAGPDWQIDNHNYDTIANSWEEKTGREYVAKRRQDVNQDGNITAAETTKESIFDLKLVSKKNNGVIWTKAHPFLVEEAEQDLEVILDNYVDSLAGHGLYAQGNLFGVEHSKVRNFTTFLVSTNIERVGSADVLAGTIEIAEVDRLKLDPTHRRSVVKLMLVKIRCFTIDNCRNELPGRVEQPDGELKRWPEVDCRGKPCRARSGLFVVGYSNGPKYFAEGLPEFDDFLKRIAFPDAQPHAVPPLRAKPPKPTTDDTAGAPAAPEGKGQPPPPAASDGKVPPPSP